MATLRAYVPSRALLRALSRPQPLQCPLVARTHACNYRNKHNKAAKPNKSQSSKAGKKQPSPADTKEVKNMIASMEKKRDDETWLEESMRPLSDEALEKNTMVINYYEQDLDKGGPRRLIQRIETKEDRKHYNDTHRMLEERFKNPDYDPAILRRRLMDDLIANPNFADLTDELMEIKQDIMTKEEIAAAEEQGKQDAEREAKELNANFRMTIYQEFQKLANDPDVGDAKGDVQKLLDKIPEVEDIDDPAFQTLLQKAITKLDANEVMSQKLAALAGDKSAEDLQNEFSEVEGRFNEAIKETESDDAVPGMRTEEELTDVTRLLEQMRDVVKSFGGDAELEAELDAALNEEELEDDNGFDFNDDISPEEFAEELKKLVERQASKKPVIEAEEPEEEENVPAELQAKVDEIMKDPKLMEKLMYIKGIIEENEREKADIISIAHETAPDPYKMEDSRTATLKDRMELARKDPEHMEAIRRLRVQLRPPFNIAPALKSFNQAMELAYIGANDDIRRILWRSYQKARSLPTFLQNVGDEAWDILYYSQAVTWGGNENRQAHLKTLIADLQSLGRDGPPTHPSTLVKNGDGDALKA